MDRHAVEEALDHIYAGRLANECEACLCHFNENATFAMAGATGEDGATMAVTGMEALRETLDVLIAQWEWHDITVAARIIDLPHVAVRYTLKATHRPSGRTVSTEIVDHLELDDELRVLTLTQFLDTALVQSVAEASS